MLKTYLYIPDHLEQKILAAAQKQQKSKAEIIRKTLEIGFKHTDQPKYGGAEVLLELAKTANKNHIKGPKDLSTNHDYYLWDLPKKKAAVKK